MRNKRLVNFLATGMFFLSVVPAMSQYGSFGLTDARQLALGNTFTSNSRELYATGKNPALLANRRYYDKKFNILFPNLSSRTYNIKAVTDFINDFFSQKPLDMITGLDGSVILKALDNNGRLQVGLQIGFLGVGYTPSDKIGSFSFSVGDYLYTNLKLPTRFSQIQSIVNVVDKVVGFRGFSFNAWWMRTWQLGYAKAFQLNPSTGLKTIHLGVALKYYSGFLYNDIKITSGVGYATEQKQLIGTFYAEAKKAYSDDFNIEAIFDPSKTLISHVPFMDPVGNGFGADFGIALLFHPGIMAGLSITDVGSIKWDGKVKNSLVAGTIKLDSNITISNIDSIAKSIVIQKESENSFSSKPATAFHGGITFQMDQLFDKIPGELNLTVDIHQSLENGPTNLDYPRVAAGFDWKPGRKWPLLLTGLTYYGISGASWSLGLGYEFSFVEVYLSSANIISYINNVDEQTLAISASWHF